MITARLTGDDLATVLDGLAKLRDQVVDGRCTALMIGLDDEGVKFKPGVAPWTPGRGTVMPERGTVTVSEGEAVTAVLVLRGLRPDGTMAPLIERLYGVMSPRLARLVRGTMVPSEAPAGE